MNQLSNLTYVSFEDGVEFIAPLKSYSLLPQYFWQLTNHKPVEMVDDETIKFYNPTEVVGQ